MDVKFAWNKKAKDNDKIVGDKNALTNKKRIADEDNQLDFITSIEKNAITSTKPVHKEKEIVIPLVQSKYQPLKIKSKLPATNAPVDIKDELKKEAMEKIIAEAKDLNDQREDDKLVIPMGDAAADISEAEEEIADADYEAVPVSKFGLAALLGMGSKQEIDARLPAAPSLPVRRSKGLGLGAVLEKEGQWPQKSKEEDEEELMMKRGARCCITKGRMSGRYCTIEAVDGNTDRVIVTLAASGGNNSVITVPSVMVRLVSEKEFKKYSKYLNRETAEAFRAQEEERMQLEREKDRARREEEERRREGRAREKEERRREKERKREKEKREKEKKREREETVTTKRAKMEPQVERCWVRPHLRVRLVDKNFHNGRFFGEKLRVMDVPSPSVCVCQTEKQRILDDINTKMLETVIPRGDRASVMVLRGDYKGELAEIVERQKERCRAVVQMVVDKSLKTYDYDDLCEFVG